MSFINYFLVIIPKMNRSRSGSIIQGAFKISTADKNKYHADLSINL